MARAVKRRRQFKFTLPEEVLDHIDARYPGKGWEKQLQTLAGLVALECLSDAMRERMIQWATQIVQDGGTWTVLLDTVKKRRGEVLDQLTLSAGLDGLRGKRRLG